MKTVFGSPRNPSTGAGNKAERNVVEIPYCGLYMNIHTTPAITSETTYGMKNTVRSAMFALDFDEIISARTRAIGSSIRSDRTIILTLCPNDFQKTSCVNISLKLSKPTNLVVDAVPSPVRGPYPFQLKRP